ncbi:hypothetical protein ACF0H5_014788 [Mactra antiquata]
MMQTSIAQRHNQNFKKILRRSSISYGTELPSPSVWQALKTNFVNAAYGLNDLKRRFSKLEYGLIENSPDHFPELSVGTKAGNTENKRTPKLLQSSMKIIPFCEEYDGFSSRKTRTISESIQALIKQKKLDEEAKLRDQVVERVIEMLSTAESRNMLKKICDDSQIDACIDELDGNLKDCLMENDINNQGKARANMFNCVSQKQNNSNMVSNIFTCIDGGYCTIKQYLPSTLTDESIPLSKNSESLSNTKVLTQDTHSIHISQESIGMDIQTDITEEKSSFLYKLQVRYVHMKGQVNCTDRKMGNMCRLSSNIRCDSITRKLYVTIDRIESLHMLRNAKMKRDIFVKVNLMSNSNLKQKTICVKSKEVISLQDTVSFDLPNIDNTKSDCLRFQIYQKKMAKFILCGKFECIGTGMVWLADCEDLYNESTLTANIYPYLTI